MNMKLIGMIVAALGLLGTGTCLTGCTSMQPKDFDQTMQAINMAREIAKEQGVAWSVEATFGPIEVYEKIALGFDHGCRLSMRFQGNAQAAARSPIEAP